MNKLKLKYLTTELARAMRPGRGRVFHMVGATLLVGSLVSNYAVAQDAPPSSGSAAAQAPSQGDSTGKNAKTLTTVTVTAQKRSEALLDVPVPVAVVQPTNLVLNNQLELSDYYTQVPGLSYSRGNVAIRGITTGTFGNPTVGVTIDDVPFGSTVANGNGGNVVPDIDPFDLQQIEVLRGPQGTLYGAASMGGLIKYETVAPQTNQLSGRLEVDTQNIDHGGEGYGVRGALNIPISDNFAVRVSGFKRDEPGYIKNVLDNNDKGSEGANGARVSALWLPSSTVTVRFSALQQNTYVNGTSNFQGDIDRVPLYGGYYYGNKIPITYDHRNTRFYDFHVDADLGWASFSSITGYSQDHITNRDDVSPIFGFIAGLVYGIPGLDADIYEPSTTSKFSQEFRLTSNEGTSKLDWQVGAFFTREQSYSNQFINPRDPDTMAVIGDWNTFFNSFGPSTYKEYALYGDVDYHFTDRFDIQVGGRYSKNEQTYSSTSTGLLNGDGTTFSGSSDAHVATYLFSPRFKLTDDVMVYARVATGYRPGGSNLGSVPGSDMKPTYSSDKTTNYELGLKGAFFDHQLVWDASVYYIDWSHIQILETSLDTGLSFVGNAGKAKSQGVENTITFQPSDTFSITANLVYNDAVLTQDFPLDGAYALSGERLPYSAKWTSNLSFDKTFPINGQWKGFAGANVAYVGDRYEDFPASQAFPRVHTPSYTQTDIHGGVTGGPWTFSLNVRNLFDRRGYLGGGPRDTLSPTSNLYSWNMIQPRTFGLTAAYKF